MRYTIIYIDSEGNWRTTTCVASHDKNEAWKQAKGFLSEGDKIQLLSPGDQIIYSEDDIRLV
jgi:hypothetical protein